MFVNVLYSDTSAQLTTHNVTMVSENFNGAGIVLPPSDGVTVTPQQDALGPCHLWSSV